MYYIIVGNKIYINGFICYKIIKIYVNKLRFKKNFKYVFEYEIVLEIIVYDMFDFRDYYKCGYV